MAGTAALLCLQRPHLLLTDWEGGRWTAPALLRYKSEKILARAQPYVVKSEVCSSSTSEGQRLSDYSGHHSLSCPWTPACQQHSLILWVTFVTEMTRLIKGWLFAAEMPQYWCPAASVCLTDLGPATRGFVWQIRANLTTANVSVLSVIGFTLIFFFSDLFNIRLFKVDKCAERKAASALGGARVETARPG